MVDPKDIITFPGGKRYITTSTAAKLLNVQLRRVRQYIEDGDLKSVQLEEAGAHYIPLKDFEKFAEKPRKAGRPAKAATKSAKKAGKK